MMLQMTLAQGEVDTGAHWLTGTAALELREETIEDTSEILLKTRYTPLGVAVGIVPWNCKPP
jgi:acyl-CoA reductase-like NAD-dependent aldehyde dehydrogenase